MNFPLLLKRLTIFALTTAAVMIFFALLPVAEGTTPGEGSSWTSILPPIMAILIALFFRSIVLALGLAFLLGAFLAFGWNPIVTIPRALNEFLLYNLKAQFNLYIFGFLFVLVGMIQVTVRSGGIQNLVEHVAKVARSRRSTQGATLLSGLVIFFDDYSNTVVVGRTLRNLTDRFHISREKLAYLVDSTTAPIAGLALISTWIAFEVFLLGTTAASLGMEASGYGIFLQMLPYRFYCLGTLLFLAINIATKREFGPMLTAEKRAASSGAVLAPNAKLLVEESSEAGPDEGAQTHWIDAVAPLATVFFGVFAGILLVGRHRLLAANEAFSFFHFTDWRAAFGRTVYDPNLPGGGPGAPLVLFWASLFGGAVAILLPVMAKRLSMKKALWAYAKTFPMLRMAIFILLMAWSMKTICETLGTSEYLLSLLGDRFPPFLVPAITFLLAAGMSFAMGTSWGTMGVMIPIMLPLAFHLSAGNPLAPILFLLTAAAVLDGAIFGDHCSPISDTTVLSSISSGCDHIHHVKTQVPYALATMVLASLLGYLPASLGLSPYFFLLLMPLAAFGIFRVFGREVA